MPCTLQMAFWKPILVYQFKKWDLPMENAIVDTKSGLHITLKGTAFSASQRNGPSGVVNFDHCAKVLGW